MNWDVFWSVLIVVFITVPLFIMWAFAIVDLFARPDLSGLAKVLWLFFVLFAPVLGTIIYYLIRPAVRLDDIPELASARAALVAESLTRLTALKEKGVISEAEFDKQRARLLAV